jgi:hypothetical protein
MFLPSISDYAREEGVSFTDAEWREMLQDPCRFGYSCQSGHALREDDPFVIAEGCPTCFGLSETYCDWAEEDREPTKAEIRERDRYLESLRDFPLIRCGKCKSNHVGVGAVRRCYGV